MKKEYVQDIVPPTGVSARKTTKSVEPEQYVDEPMISELSDAGKGIRNIGVSRTRQRMNDRLVDAPRAPRGSMIPGWVMGLGGVVLVALIGCYFVFASRKTVVTITPRSQHVTFSEGTPFTAFPAAIAATGSLAYTVETRDLDETATITIPAGATPSQPHKASGTVTVVNEYQTKPVRLLKNTRFQTPDGLIFRAPSDIVIPAKKGTVAGTVNVTIVADEDGSKYNVGPTDKFTVPGLKSIPAEYARVYAKSSVAMTGGADAGAGAEAINSGVMELRAKIRKDAAAIAATLSNDSTVAFPGLVQITYKDLPSENLSDTAVKVHQQAHVEIPIFQTAAFANNVAQLVASDVQQNAFKLVIGNDCDATPSASSTAMGTDPLSFSMHGSAVLVWKVDSHTVVNALLGRNRAAFKTIVTGFPSIQEATTRIEPFWQDTFPTTADNVTVTLKDPSKK